MPTSTLTITKAGRNLSRDGSAGANDPKITYIALGTDNTPPTIDNTKLGNEVFRKAITSRTNGLNPGELLINLYLAPTDAVGDNIQEVGFFGSSTASAAPNSGVLIARGLFAHNTKSALESIQFQLDLNYN